MGDIIHLVPRGQKPEADDPILVREALWFFCPSCGSDAFRVCESLDMICTVCGEELNADQQETQDDEEEDDE